MSEPEAKPKELGTRVQCPQHGLWYEPKLRSGCVLCRRTSAPAPPAPAQLEEPAPWRASIALVLSIGLLGFVLLGGSVLRPLGLAPAAKRGPERSVAGPTRAVAQRVEPAVQPEIALPEPVSYCAMLARGGGPIIGNESLPTGGLHKAAATGDVVRILQDIELGAAKDQLDGEGRTPLAWAVLLDRRDAAIALLRNGVRPDVPLRYGETALMLAARGGNRPLVDALLAAGASAAAVDERQQTALMFAASGGRSDAVEALAQLPATLEMRCALGMSALHYAARGMPCDASMAKLLAKGAVLEARDNDGATPLLRALEQAHVDNAAFLIKQGADVNARDYKGRGAFDYVVSPRTVDPKNRDHLQGVARLKDALQLLIGWKADRRLGLDPRSQAILFRDELNELAEREGRPRLPELEAQQQAQGDRAPRAGEAPVQHASRRLFRKTQMGSMRTTALLDGAQIFQHGWARVPAIVRRVVLRSSAPRAQQRLLLAGSSDGRADWGLSDVLLIETMSGKQRRKIVFIGAADELRIGDATIARLGRAANHFTASEFDVTELLSTDHGADHVVLTALDYGKGFTMSDVHLVVRGPDANVTADRFEIEHSIAGRSP